LREAPIARLARGRREDATKPSVPRVLLHALVPDVDDLVAGDVDGGRQDADRHETLERPCDAIVDREDEIGLGHDERGREELRDHQRDAACSADARERLIDDALRSASRRDEQVRQRRVSVERELIADDRVALANDARELDPVARLSPNSGRRGRVQTDRSSKRCGVGVHAADDLFVAVGSYDPAVTSGVYRVPAAGGDATLFATHASMAFPNGITRSADGDLFVSDSAAGIVFHVAADGTAEPWAMDVSLLGTATPACGSTGVAFPIGANGIVHDGSSVLVANTDLAQLVRIPVESDGTAGAPAVAVGPDCESLFGVDGLASDGADGYYATVQIGSSVVHVAPSGAITVIGSGAPLDGPASAAAGDFGGERSLVVTSSAFGSIATPGATPLPGLVALSL
jgi:sugar lactone lactonase YvrE